MALNLNILADAPAQGVPSKIVPPGSKPGREFFKNLFAKDARKVYSGKELTTIGMPCGGVAAGQLYVRGDGTLAQWWIFNNYPNTGYGDRCYTTYRPDSPLSQGFAIRVQAEGGKPMVRTLSQDDFDAIEFIGEYPIAEIRYKAKQKPALPVEVSAEVFSPFIPLNAKDSAIPATILRYTVRNPTDRPMDVTLGGWLENPVCRDYAGVSGLVARNTVVRDNRLTSIRMDVAEAPLANAQERRRVAVFEDFESGTYEKWTKTGDAFGDKPATGTAPNQQDVSGWRGKFFVNTYQGSDQGIGTLTSSLFKISEPYLCFLIGGGNHAGRTCMNLLIDGKVVRSAVGANNEALREASWNVSEFVGREARLQIIDDERGGWGHINIDHIYFTNLPPGKDPAKLRQDPGFGDLTLSCFDPVARAIAAVGPEDVLRVLEPAGADAKAEAQSYPLAEKRCCALASNVRLMPDQSHTFTFIVSWFFPNRPNVGQMYSNWFAGSVTVADYIAQNFDRLSAETHLFRDTWFNTTLPYWFAARLAMPVSILATETVQWWKNGRFYAWEGVGCCHGTCTHVWNYEHTTGRVFPELARSTRLMQDLGVAQDPKTGLVGFRGAREYAADGQCGTVLKVYREHLMTTDTAFLKQAWPGVKLAMQFLLSHDKNDDGVIEDTQHNTFDINFEGPNTFVGSLYLAALRAAEEMAKLMGDGELANRYRAAFEKGRQFTMARLYNGEYFHQIIPEGKPDRFQYGNGCLSDQLFGQGWAHQTGLDYIYPREAVLSGLAAVFKHNWTNDVGPYNAVYPPQRWFARPGDGGLFTATWPRGGRPNEPVLYRDEVWTGIEYQVANHMLYEGMVEEAFAIVRAIHDRYDGTKHNPWNEVECGDHYARAMASWGCLLGVSGFIYDGPRALIGFAPRVTPDDFRCFYTSAQSWGTLSQKRTGNQQISGITPKWGTLGVSKLILAIPENAAEPKATVTAAGKPVQAKVARTGSRLMLDLGLTTVVKAGEGVEAKITWA